MSKTYLFVSYRRILKLPLHSIFGNRYKVNKEVGIEMNMGIDVSIPVLISASVPIDK